MPSHLVSLSRISMGSAYLLKKWTAIGVLLVTFVGLTSTLLSNGPQEPKSKEQAKKQEEAKKDEPQVEIADGFPMPEAAIRRFGNRQLRHPDYVMTAAISPDGKYLVTVGYVTMVIWDLQTLKAKQVIQDQRKYRYYPYMGMDGLQFTKDSQYLMINPGDDTGLQQQERNSEIAHLWQIESGKRTQVIQTKQFSSHKNWFSADSKRLFSIYRNSIHSYDLQTGKHLKTIGLENWQDHLQYELGRANDKLLVLPLQNNSGLKGFDCETGKELFTIEENPIQQLAISSDSKRLAYKDGKGRIHVYNVVNQKEITSFEHSDREQAGTLAFSPDGNIVYSGTHNGILFRWDIQANKMMPNLGRHSLWTLTSILPSADGKMLYTTGADKVIQRWDLTTGKQHPLPDGYMTTLALTTSVDGKTLFICDHAGALHAWSLVNGKREKRLIPGGSYGLNCVTRSQDGKWLAVGRVQQDIQLWDLLQEKAIQVFSPVAKPDPYGGDPIRNVAFSPDNKVLYSTSYKTGLTAFEIPSGKQLWNVGNPEQVMIVVDPKGRWIAQCGGYRQGDGSFQLVDPKNGQPIRKIEIPKLEPAKDQNTYNYEPWPIAITASSDGSLLATAHYDGSVRTWNPETGKQVSIIRISNYGANTVAFSPDDKWLACSNYMESGGSIRKVRLLELVTGKEILHVQGHDSDVTQIVFASDGRSIITNADLSPIQWSLKPKQLPKVDLSSAALWELFGSEDAAKVYGYQWALAENPELLLQMAETKIKPADFTMDRKRFDQLLTDLDGPRFRVRETAQKELAQLGEVIPIDWLHESLKAKKSAEQVNRLQQLLEERNKPSIRTRQLSRTIQGLELAGSTASKRLLEKWTAEAPGSLLAKQAQAALNRMK